MDHLYLDFWPIAFYTDSPLIPIPDHMRSRPPVSRKLPSSRHRKKKSSTDTSLNDYPPVALTPIIMKCLKRPVKDRITLVLPPSLDSTRSAYRPKRPNWGRCTLCAKGLEHLEKHNAHVRMLFVDFRSSFNTETPRQLMSTLRCSLGLSPPPQCAAGYLTFLLAGPSQHMWAGTFPVPSKFETNSNQFTISSTCKIKSFTSWLTVTCLPVLKTHSLLNTWWGLFFSELLSYTDLPKFTEASTLAFMSADSQQSGTPKILH